MRSPLGSSATVILSHSWKLPESELSFVTRSVAGAASRTSEVTIVVPAAAGPPEPDGAFDLFGTGVGRTGSWPEPTDAAWPDHLPVDPTIVIDQPDPAARALLDRHAPNQTGHAISPVDSDPGHSITPLRFAGSVDDSDADFIHLHVPINPIAATHRHNGLGFTDYLLVLSDRCRAPEVYPPTDLVAWLTARFPNQYVVVIEDATAAVWRGRVLRGVVSVYTRTDLWRLLAHARVTIDLAPGPIVARECIESLRFGTPLLVPAQSAARAHADAGGGLTFTGFTELLSAVDQVSDDTLRATLSSQGRHYADTHYGDQKAFVNSVSRLVGPPVPSNR
jgi:hypothetical protein